MIDGIIRECEICGELKSNKSIDHAECSKLLQEMHKDDKHQAKAKKLSQQAADYLTDYIHRIEDEG